MTSPYARALVYGWEMILQTILQSVAESPSSIELRTSSVTHASIISRECLMRRKNMLVLQGVPSAKPKPRSSSNCHLSPL